MVAIDCKAFILHAALLAVGAKSGSPVKFQPEYKAPTGTPIESYAYGPFGEPQVVKTNPLKALAVQQVRTVGKSVWVEASDVQSSQVSPASKVPMVVEPVSTSCATGCGEPAHWPGILPPFSSRKTSASDTSRPARSTVCRATSSRTIRSAKMALSPSRRIIPTSGRF